MAAEAQLTLGDHRQLDARHAPKRVGDETRAKTYRKLRLKRAARTGGGVDGGKALPHAKAILASLRYPTQRRRHQLSFDTHRRVIQRMLDEARNGERIHRRAARQIEGDGEAARGDRQTPQQQLATHRRQRAAPIPARFCEKKGEPERRLGGARLRREVSRPHAVAFEQTLPNLRA